MAFLNRANSVQWKKKSADIGKPPQRPINSFISREKKKHSNVNCSLVCKRHRIFSDRRDRLRDDALEERRIHHLTEIAVL
jgi:hypothetical protein